LGPRPPAVPGRERQSLETGDPVILAEMRVFPGRIDLLALAAIVLVGMLLLLPRLDDRALWEDEAETALLAKNVLRFGVPVAWDGRDLISQECGEDVDRNFLWRQTPWLPIYLVALSFRLFGASAYAARLPFVLVALVTLPSLALLARRMFADRLVAPLATMTLALSVPFLLFARQCRYYSLVALATVWTLIAFFALLEGSSSTIGRASLAMAGLVVALTVLFHSNYLVFAATIVALVAAAIVARATRAQWTSLAIVAIAIAALMWPWLVIFDAGGKTSLVAHFASPAAFVLRLERYAGAIELYMFPTIVLAVTLALVVVARPGQALPDVRAALSLAAFSAVFVVALAVTPLLFSRYLVGLLPVFALLTGYVIASLARVHAAIAATLFALLLVVDRADFVHGALGSPLSKYVDEITHDFDGPIETIARVLARNASPGDRVFVTYGALGLRFHSSSALQIRGGTSCQSLAGWPEPEWLVVRRFFRLNPVAAAGREDAVRVRDWVNARIVSGEYRRFELPAVDIAHDAIPEPDVHHYRMPRDGTRVAIWRRMIVR
jgi:hypothetical protein